MVYWTDVEATPGATRALINDLDLTVQDPASTLWQPWILDHTPNGAALSAPATRGRDSINNMEQVTLQNPAPGSYTVTIAGNAVPVGPQRYYLVWEFRKDEITLTYPTGGEGFVPGETETLHWDSDGGTGDFTVEYSLDSGATWMQAATNIPATQKYYNLTVPNAVTANALVRVSRGAVADTSDRRFNIIGVPQNLDVIWSCGTQCKLVWDAVPGATAYQVYQLGSKYMDPIGTTSSAHFTVPNVSLTDSTWFSVAALGTNGLIGRRAIALKKLPGDANCVSANASVGAVLSHESGQFPDCQSPPDLLTISLINVGVDTLTDIPVFYQVNGGTSVADTLQGSIGSADTATFTFSTPMNLTGSGSYTLTVWTAYPGDTLNGNDTAQVALSVYASTSATIPFFQNFDNFTTCSTAWGCETITCGLSAGWFNVPNTPAVNPDSIDWRTHTGSTGTGGTGPSSDHTSGSGNYLYLEGSGNGGSGCRNKWAMLHSPCFDLTGTNDPQLSWWYHANGGAIGELHVDALANGQWHLDIAPEVSGSQGNQWNQATADLSPFQGQEVVIRFRGSTGNGYIADLAIDDVNLDTRPLSAFSVSAQLICPGDTVQFTDLSTYADTWNWQISPAGFSFVNGTNASSRQPAVQFTAPGIYTVSLITTNASGADTLTQTAYINAGPHTLNLAASTSDSLICQGDTLTFTASGNYAAYQFSIDGITQQNGPANTFVTASLQNGQTVSVQAEVNAGCSTDIDSLTYAVDAPLQTTLQIDSSLCPFLSFSVPSTGGGARYWQWDFGDGVGMSTDSAPSYDYAFAGPGFYIVNVITGNACGEDTLTQTVLINCIDSREGLQNLKVTLYPNPGIGLFWLQLEGLTQPVALELWDLQGKTLDTRTLQPGPDRHQLDLRHLPAGVYLLKGRTEHGTFYRKLTLTP